MRRQKQGLDGVAALGSGIRQRRASALRASIRPCIEQLEGRALLSGLVGQGDLPAEGGFPAIVAAESSGEVRAVVSGQGSIVQGVPYVLNLSATGSGVSTIQSWRIDWGDGQAETLAGNPSSASHAYGAAGNYTISAHATTGDGVEHEAVSAQVGTPVLVGNFSNPSVVFEFKGWKYFTADSGGFPALWRTDGTAAGTVPIKQLKPDENYPFPWFEADKTTFYRLGERLLFATRGLSEPVITHTLGAQTIWTTDGTAAGTWILDYLGGVSFSPIQIGKEIIYCTEEGYERTDGVSVPSMQLSAPNRGSDPHRLAGINNRLYYIDAVPSKGYGLWTSDGTAEGARLLKSDLSRGQLGDFAEVGGKTYFIYTPIDEYGRPLKGELWTTDGTPEGTRWIGGGAGSDSATQLLSVNGTLLCVFKPDSGLRQLWRSDGTAQGTTRLKDACDYSLLVGSLDGAILFKGYDAEHGWELWRTDGTVAGTKLVKDLTAGAESSSIDNCVRVGDRVYFRDYSSYREPNKLWRTDGTEAGTVSIPGVPVGFGDLQNSNDTLVFRAGESLYAYEAWKADGLVRLSDPTAIKVQSTSHVSTAGEMLFFDALSLGNNGTQLWRAGGEESQVVRVVRAVETSGAGSADEGSAYTLRLGYNGVPTDSIGSWTVRWGDGMVETIVGHPDSITHVYADDGTYTIAASASDGARTYAASDTVATIRNVLPSLTIQGGEQVVVGRPYELSLAASDPGDDHIQSWTIDWGDGSVQTIEGNPSSARHTYAVKGNYTITASVTDEDGRSSKLYGVSRADSYPSNDPADAHEFTSPGGFHYYCKKSVESHYVPFIGPGEEWELWRDDGKGGEAVMLHSFWAYDPFYSMRFQADPLPLNRAPSHFMSVGDTVFFGAYTRYDGFELWATSDTATDAWLVKDLHPGSYPIRATGQVLGYEPCGSIPSNLFERDGKLYFIAGDGNEVTLWQTDGHEVTKADDIVSKLGANPTSAIVLDDLLILSTRDEQRRLEIYQMDSAGVVTPLLAAHPDGYEPKLVDGRIYFSPWVITGGPVHLSVKEPTTNITMSGSGTVVDGSAHTLSFGYGGLDLSSIRSVTIDWGDGHKETLEGHPALASHTYAANGSYSISAYAVTGDGVEHEAVSAQVGTPVLVGTFANPSAVFEYQGLKYFTADQNDVPALWRSDGTAAGTYPIKALEPEGYSPSPFDSASTKFFNIGGRMVLLTTPEAGVGDPMRPGQTGVWTSDGTGAGTLALDRFFGWGSAVFDLGSKLIYTQGDRYKVTDGVTTAALDGLAAPNAQDLRTVVVNNSLYYCFRSASNKNELWKSDGTAEGTRLIKGDLPSGYFGNAVEVDGKVYFNYAYYSSGTGGYVNQLWVSDDTPNGTSVVKSVSAPTNIDLIAGVNHSLLFFTTNGTERVCWKTDGTTDGTIVLKDNFGAWAVVNGILYFISSDAAHGRELWRTDGTVAGTKRLTDVNPGPADSVVNIIGGSDDVYFATSSNPALGLADMFWRTDGTESGIVGIDGMPSFYKQDIQISNGTLVCRGNGGIYAYEDWKGDGMVRLTEPATLVNSQSRLYTAGEMLFFTSPSGAGTALWRAGGDGPQVVRVVSAISTADSGQAVDEGSAYTLRLLYNAVEANSIRSWSIDWGDGRVETIEGHPGSINHTYADDGMYTIRASASDGSRTYVATDTKASVLNVPPLLSLSGDDKVASGIAYTLNLAASDPGDDHIRSWTIDWGDGVVETIEGNPSSARHTYTVKGNYTITASARDEDGSWSRLAYVGKEADSYPSSNPDQDRELVSPRGIHYWCELDPQTRNNLDRTWVLWRQDGTATERARLGEFHETNRSMYTVGRYLLPPTGFTFLGETLYFAGDGADGYELWAVDDKTAQPWLVKDLNPGTHQESTMGMARQEPNSSEPHDLVSFDGKLYFVAYDGIAKGLWQIDGQAVTKADDIVNKLGVNPTHVFGLDDMLVLTTSINSRLEFYWMDHAGTIRPLVDSQPVWIADSTAGVTMSNGQIYFRASAPGGKERSWVINGGPAHVAVAEANPRIELSGQAKVAEGSAYTLNLGYLELDPSTVQSLTIHWGDGTAETVPGGPATVSHVFADGSLAANISVSWTDESGTHENADSQSVSVENVAPVLTLSGGATAMTGKEYVLALGSSDPGQDVIKSWRIDWGDGRVETIQGNPSRAVHRYEKAGSFKISASATDEDGTYAAGNKVGVKVSQTRGSIAGWVFNDLSGEGVWDKRERGVFGWCVYIDSNGNGRWDKKEPWMLTDVRGRYTFGNLLPGTYKVAVSLPKGWRQSGPKGAVDLTVKGEQVITQTFAVTQKVLASKPVFNTGKGKTMWEAIKDRRGSN